MKHHNIGTRAAWLAARLELLQAEKDLTRRSDALAQQRQALPWVPVFHTIVTRTNGSPTATQVRRAFVKGPLAPTTYDAWAETNLPEGLRGRSEAAFDDGLSNLVRFGFDPPLSQRGAQVVQVLKLRVDEPLN